MYQEGSAPPSARNRTEKAQTAATASSRLRSPSSLSVLEAAALRRDPIDLLEQQTATRLPELAPIRYGRMLVSPFAFFRGGASLMAADLADGPRTGLHAQLCGDAHLSNFGIYAAPDRRLVFSINDFDETLPGPFEWDVKRLAASLAVAGQDRGFDETVRRAVVTAAVREYREAMARFAAMGNVHVWYARLDVGSISDQLAAELSGKQMKRLKATLQPLGRRTACERSRSCVAGSTASYGS